MAEYNRSDNSVVKPVRNVSKHCRKVQKKMNPTNTTIIYGYDRFKIKDNNIKNKIHTPKTPPGTPPPLINHLKKNVTDSPQK